jgi:hypothetical protein
MDHEDIPNTKLSGLKIWPNGPDLTESVVPGSRSTRMARGTYLLPMGARGDLDLCFAGFMWLSQNLYRKFQHLRQNE